MPKANAADQTVTVRLPAGHRDRVVALTGQPFSRLVRRIVLEIIKREEAKLAAGGAKAVDQQQRDVGAAVNSI